MGNEILLESGTNEVEILEFFLGEQGFGINIAKIAQILPFERSKLTVVPHSSPAFMGALLWQGQTIPLIDLKSFLHLPPLAVEHPIVLVTEFNGVKNGFLTDGVNRIHRVSWGAISPMGALLDRYSSACTGSIHIEDKDIMLIDFEFIIASINPETSISNKHMNQQVETGRENKWIIFVEDSAFIRNTIASQLQKCGFAQVDVFENGLDACNHIQHLVEKTVKDGADILSALSLVVTDIEMPKMDGLALCKFIKKELRLETVPVILFSSLINEQMALKCQEVGANAFLTKPRVDELVVLMDSLLEISKD
ncbi:MAG: chemotaxis signal transduction protein CheV [Desulfobulbaceae bacterium]|nr:MAG: chemotaxis signal transduction protein CheV [Desulfobulbaceae bacterium]